MENKTGCNCAACQIAMTERLKHIMPCGCIDKCKGHGTDTVTPIDVIPDLTEEEVCGPIPEMPTFESFETDGKTSFNFKR